VQGIKLKMSEEYYEEENRQSWYDRYNSRTSNSLEEKRLNVIDVINGYN